MQEEAETSPNELILRPTNWIWTTQEARLILRPINLFSRHFQTTTAIFKLAKTKKIKATNFL